MLADETGPSGQNYIIIPEGALAAADNQLHDTGRERLKAFIERIENVNKARANLGHDLKEIYAEAQKQRI